MSTRVCVTDQYGENRHAYGHVAAIRPLHEASGTIYYEIVLDCGSRVDCMRDGFVTARDLMEVGHV